MGSIVDPTSVELFYELRPFWRLRSFPKHCGLDFILPGTSVLVGLPMPAALQGVVLGFLSAQSCAALRGVCRSWNPQRKWHWRSADDRLVLFECQTRTIVEDTRPKDLLEAKVGQCVRRERMSVASWNPTSASIQACSWTFKELPIADVWIVYFVEPAVKVVAVGGPTVLIQPGLTMRVLDVREETVGVDTTLQGRLEPVCGQVMLVFTEVTVDADKLDELLPCIS
jgi:hypothetical protein